MSFAKGASFDVTLTLSNPNSVDSASNFNIDRDGIFWDPTYFVQLDLAKSTCSATHVLNPGQSCVFVLTFKPNPTNGSFARSFLITYQNSKSATETIKFDLSGAWTVTMPSIVIAPGAAPQIIDANAVAHELFGYGKRAVKRTPPDTTVYPLSFWNQIKAPDTIMPWTFPYKASMGDSHHVGKLADIVPDRWRDPTTGKEYVVLYHGTTSDTLPIFTQGADAISFSSATNTSFGMGFYLASNPNEAKYYACWRLGDRKKKDPTLTAILLVVGVEVNDRIRGRLEKNSSGLSDSISGDPLYPSTYFGRTYENQFVFFSNSHTNSGKYMKIIKIVKLGRNFGMAASLNEHSHVVAEGDNSPDTDSSLMCGY